MSEKTPPSNLPPGKAAEWWREKLAKEGQGGRIPTTGSYERICSYCGSVNPCTGSKVCGQCQESLKGAKRTKNDPRHTPSYC